MNQQANAQEEQQSMGVNKFIFRGTLVKNGYHITSFFFLTCARSEWYLVNTDYKSICR